MSRHGWVRFCSRWVVTIQRQARNMAIHPRRGKWWRWICECPVSYDVFGRHNMAGGVEDGVNAHRTCHGESESVRVSPYSFAESESAVSEVPASDWRPGWSVGTGVMVRPNVVKLVTLVESVWTSYTSCHFGTGLNWPIAVTDCLNEWVCEWLIDWPWHFYWLNGSLIVLT